jgi:hypothetical protein
MMYQVSLPLIAGRRHKHISVGCASKKHLYAFEELPFTQVTGSKLTLKEVPPLMLLLLNDGIGLESPTIRW